MKYLTPILASVVLINCVPNQSLLQAQVDAPEEASYHQFVNPSTICVIRLPAESIASPTGLLKTADFASFVDAMKEYSQGQDVLISVGTPEARRSPAVGVFVHKQGRTAREVDAAIKPYGFGPVETSGEYFVMPLFPPSGPSATSANWTEDSERFAELDAALRVVSEQSVQIAVLPPRHLWRAYREVLPTLPSEVGGGPSSVLTDGVVWAAIGIDLANNSFKFHVQSASAEAANELAEAIPNWINRLADTLRGGTSAGLSALLAASQRQISPRGSTVSGTFAIKGAGTQIAKDAMERVLAPVSTRRKSQQLKRMMLAFHNHESAYKYFPPGPKARGEDGRPWLSWRVHLLPFLGKEGLALWKRFNLDEPWDSEHNLTLLEEMPDVYALPAGILANKPIRPGHTTFQAPIAENSIMGQDEAITFSDVTDGTSNTIVIVEVKPENAVPWTAPQDYQFDAEDPAAGLYVEADGGFNCAFADGSAHRIPADLPAKTFRDLCGMNDGQVTNLP